MKNNISYYFIGLALISLVVGMFFGVLGGMQYLLPDFLKEALAFNKIRPLHVALVVSWIILGASGIVYFRFRDTNLITPFTNKLPYIHLGLFLFSGVMMIFFLMMGKFSGREYLAFTPWLLVPILCGWILMAIWYFSNVFKMSKRRPVYLWMWGTGIVFFIFTLMEGHLYLIPFFKENIIRDMTVQWKSYGSLVGSWNMLVYGSGIFVMYQIHQDEKIIFGKLPFFLFFLSLVNLMFGWAHHTYILPFSPWIRNIAYLVSMSELLILGMIILNWKKSLQKSESCLHPFACKFLLASDVWILLNLVLAIIISVPAINYYTHGTHITVAHAMGTTIGINSMILFGGIYFVIGNSFSSILSRYVKLVERGFVIFQISFIVFWLALIISGVLKSIWMYGAQEMAYYDLQQKLIPWYIIFFISGIFIFISLIMIVFPLIKSVFSKSKL